MEHGVSHQIIYMGANLIAPMIWPTLGFGKHNSGRLPSVYYYVRATFHVSTIQKSSESPIGS